MAKLTFDVGGIAAAVFGVDFHLICPQAGGGGLGLGDNDGAVVDTERFPGGVDLRAGVLPENVFFHERAVEALSVVGYAKVPDYRCY